MPIMPIISIRMMPFPHSIHSPTGNIRSDICGYCPIRVFRPPILISIGCSLLGFIGFKHTLYGS